MYFSMCMAQAGHFIAFANQQTVGSLVHQLRQLWDDIMPLIQIPSAAIA